MLHKFINICKMGQKDLKKYLKGELVKYGYSCISNDGYLYARGKIEILLTAHMDTVHKELCKTVSFKDSAISSPEGIGGDDRCGVYIILALLEKGFRPYILFCEDEEIGGIGSLKFCKSKYINDLSNMNYLIELDRANASDAVFYDCANDLFTNYILKETGYKERTGSFSDICNLSQCCGIASVNLSCGYYNAHRTNEYVVFEEMLNTANVVAKLLSNVDSIQYEYIEEYDYMRFESIQTEGIVEVLYYKNNEEKYGVGYGETESEAMLNFFINNLDVCFNDIFDYTYF